MRSWQGESGSLYGISQNVGDRFVSSVSPKSEYLIPGLPVKRLQLYSHAGAGFAWKEKKALPGLCLPHHGFRPTNLSVPDHLSSLIKNPRALVSMRNVL